RTPRAATSRWSTSATKRSVADASASRRRTPHRLYCLRLEVAERAVQRIFVSFVIAGAVLLMATPVSAQRPAPVRELVQLDEDLYRARNGNWYTILLVTPDGIILGDPINRDFARWLRMELDMRFDVPVRYVVYSH